MSTEHGETAALFVRLVAERGVRCPVCRYSLRGAREARCPECGEGLELHVVHSRARELVQVTSAGAFLLAGMFLGLIFWLDITDTVPWRLRSTVVVARGIMAVVCLIIAIGVYVVLRPRPSSAPADTAAPDDRPAIMRELIASGLYLCPTRSEPIRDVTALRCPVCGDRLAVRVRPLRPLSVWDARARWIVGEIAMLGFVSLIPAAGLSIALLEWSRVGVWRPVSTPPWSGRYAVLFWSAALVVAINLLLACWLWLRRRRLMRSGWAEAIWPFVVPAILLLEMFVLWLAIPK